MHSHSISNKLINDITFILNKRTDMNIYVDMLLFEEDKNKKQIMIDKLLNILLTKTTTAAICISRFNFIPKYTNIIVRRAFPKKPDIKTLKSNLPFILDAIAPNIVSNIASIATDTYIEYVYGIIGRLLPINTPKYYSYNHYYIKHKFPFSPLIKTSYITSIT